MVITTTELVSEGAYRELALMDENRRLELFRGRLREKPPVSVEHSYVAMNLVELLLKQLERDRYRVSLGQARLRVSSDTYYIPDVTVIPSALVQALRATPRVLDAYPEPMPLVVEVWSPSTGDYDFSAKLPDYQCRGDQEIWYIHPYQRTITAWRRQREGTYIASTYRSGTVRAESLSDFAFDVEALFEP
jgi:Uma2 family endonuclease